MEINAKNLLGYLREVRKVSSGNILELNEKMKQKVLRILCMCERGRDIYIVFRGVFVFFFSEDM